MDGRDVGWRDGGGGELWRGEGMDERGEIKGRMRVGLGFGGGAGRWRDVLFFFWGTERRGCG